MSIEQKIEKLQQAIRLGFIKKHIDPDGIVRYELTLAGQKQWITEMRQNGTPFDMHFSTVNQRNGYVD